MGHCPADRVRRAHASIASAESDLRHGYSGKAACRGIHKDLRAFENIGASCGLPSAITARGNRALHRYMSICEAGLGRMRPRRKKKRRSR